MDTSQQRVSDAERTVTTDLLRTAGEEGRLDVDELDDRVARALTARTRAELDGLTADLPAPAPAPPSAPRLWQRNDVRGPLIGLLSASGVCTLVWLATGADGYFWPLWIFVGLGIALIGSVSRALSGQPDGRERPDGANSRADR